MYLDACGSLLIASVSALRHRRENAVQPSALRKHTNATAHVAALCCPAIAWLSPRAHAVQEALDEAHGALRREHRALQGRFKVAALQLTQARVLLANYAAADAADAALVATGGDDPAAPNAAVGVGTRGEQQRRSGSDNGAREWRATRRTFKDVTGLAQDRELAKVDTPQAATVASAAQAAVDATASKMLASGYLPTARPQRAADGVALAGAQAQVAQLNDELAKLQQQLKHAQQAERRASQRAEAAATHTSAATATAAAAPQASAPAAAQAETDGAAAEARQTQAALKQAQAQLVEERSAAQAAQAEAAALRQQLRDSVAEVQAVRVAAARAPATASDGAQDADTVPEPQRSLAESLGQLSRQLSAAAERRTSTPASGRAAASSQRSGTPQSALHSTGSEHSALAPHVSFAAPLLLPGAESADREHVWPQHAASTDGNDSGAPSRRASDAESVASEWARGSVAGAASGLPSDWGAMMADVEAAVAARVGASMRLKLGLLGWFASNLRRRCHAEVVARCAAGWSLAGAIHLCPALCSIVGVWLSLLFSVPGFCWNALTSCQ